MNIKALLFDINGTVTDICTDEGYDDVYRTTANFLMYQGVLISPDEFREEYWKLNKLQRGDSHEKYPEFDVVKIFEDIVARYAGAYTAKLPHRKRLELPGIAAEVFRAASLFKLELFSGVRDVLTQLSAQYRLAAVSDGQRRWAIPELNMVGILDFFQPIIISSDYLFRKPDGRMFFEALDRMNVAPEESVYIGNDMYRDVYGPGKIGMKTIYFRSASGEQRAHGIEPDYIVYRFEDIPEALNFLRNRF